MSTKPVLKILAASLDYPDINECFTWRSTRPTKHCSAPGLYVELTNLLADGLNMSVQYINADKEMLKYSNTTLTDEDMAVQYLQNGTVDLIAAYFDSPNLFGAEFDLTVPIYFSYTKFIVAQTNSTLTGVFDFFTVYDPYIWTLIFACFFFVMFIYMIIWKVGTTMMIKESTNIGGFAWKLIRLQLSQVDSSRQTLLSSNFLLLIFAFGQALLIIRMYNNLITTQAVRYVDPKPFQDNELLQVLGENKYSLIFQNKMRWWYRDITTSPESPFFEIRDAIKNNKIVLADESGVDDDNLDNYVMDKVRDGRWITIGSNEDIVVSRHAGYCNMIYIDTNFRPRPKSLLMRKNHPLFSKLNHIILEETIHIRRLHNKYYKYSRPPKCERNTNEPKALTINPFYGVIFLYLFGALSGFVAFCIELIYKRWK